LSYILRNDVQILLIQVGLSGWFFVSVVPFGYVVGVGCSTFVLFRDLTEILNGLIIRIQNCACYVITTSYLSTNIRKWLTGNKLDFSSFPGSVVSCNLEYKRSFPLNWMHSVERRGVAVLCLVFITTCPDGSPRRTVLAVDCALMLWYLLLCLRVLPSVGVV